jgi:predicted enzyme related to lactoylglutathione lyase
VTTRIGFKLRRDESYGDERWIEVGPPEGGPLLVLSPRAPEEPTPDELPHSPVFFNCADIEATHRELSERDVEFPTPPTQQHFGGWAVFEDPDGTRYALGQWVEGARQTRQRSEGRDEWPTNRMPRSSASTR